MIMAAGLGTRLKPWTLSHPKALVPVEGVPVLERLIVKLRDEGFEHIVVNVHHFQTKSKFFWQVGTGESMCGSATKRIDCWIQGEHSVRHTACCQKTTDRFWFTTLIF